MKFYLSLGLCEVCPKGTFMRTVITRNAQNFLTPLSSLKRHVLMMPAGLSGLFSLVGKEQDLNYHLS